MVKGTHLKVEQDRIIDPGKFPKVVLIDTTSYCNLKCSMCGHKDMSRKRGNMDFGLFKKIIDEIADTDKSIRVWLVFFGEALLLRKTTLFPMLSYAKEKGLRDVVLNSNGNLLDDYTSRGLIENGLDGIYIGIDAFSEDVYEKVRVGGDYDKVVNNVKNLLRLKEELNAKKPEVFVQFVEMDENKHQIKRFIDFWKEQGATVKIRPKVSWAGLVDASNLTISQDDRFPCYWAMQTMSIADDGRVVLCAVDVDARFVAGDVNKESLYSIWNGRLKEIRDMHNRGNFGLLPFPCNECLDWQSARADFYTTAE